MGSLSQTSPTIAGQGMPSSQPDALPLPPSTSAPSPVRKTAPPPRDARSKRASPPKLGAAGGKDTASSAGAARWTGKTRFNSSATAKPLVPVTERNPGMRAKGRASEDRVDITPDGGSAGRDGRQFTVANVGNNGRIYLRPSVRPAHQRYPQPNFVFPVTPPATARLDSLTQPSDDNTKNGNSATDAALWTPTPPTPSTTRQNYFSSHSHRLANHRRALSDSTRDEPEPGGFKIVISKPGDDKRPKTMEDIDPAKAKSSLLNIDIPTGGIGNPRFTLKGTPFFRGSSYAPTEEFPRSSNVSFLRSHRGDLTPHLVDQSSGKPSLLHLPDLHLPSNHSLKSPTATSIPMPVPYRSTYLSTHLVIEPAMFDSFTFKPMCDDRVVVRYASSNGAVTAATPPRLVAEITSPTFLDYELISDFFLTYRAFLEPSDLLRMLVARLRWALARGDEAGMVVRVRTFVAMRHWILNYFMDDFLVDYALRVSFCNLLNDFVQEINQDERARKVQLKILAELKKCWRRVCAQYWDGPQFETSLGADVPIAPGGIAGHRNASLDPSFWEMSDGPPRLSSLFAHLNQTTPEESFYADDYKSGHYAGDLHIMNRPATPEQQHRPTGQLERQQTSPSSIMSMDIVSCSIPGKISRAVQPGTDHPLGAHPVPPNTLFSNVAAVATTPRALSGKRVRPSQGHKKNGSLPDSMREKEHLGDNAGLDKDGEVLMPFPFDGNLVRGNLLPPSQPFVEVTPPSLNSEQRQTTVFQHDPLFSEKSVASAMSGQGMRRLIGSVRRHLSTRGQGVSPTQGNFINISPLGPRGATTNRLPGTAIVPQARPHRNGVRAPVRIDLLGAETAESFKRAVREDAAADAAADAEKQDSATYSLPRGFPLATPVPEESPHDSGFPTNSLVALPNPSLITPKDSELLRPTSDAAITTGSKSIVIVDNTVPLPAPRPPLPGVTSSVHNSFEAFGDNLVPRNADPTPPTTPPGQPLDTPQKPHGTLNRYAAPPPASADQLPPFVPDLATLDPGRPSEDAGRPSTDITRPSTEFAGRSFGRPPLSSSKMHRRQQSSRTNRSLNSILHRRVMSAQSGWAAPSTVRSFDATTYTGSASVADEEESEDPVPQPLRVLRRRPGGDLRAATNVGDLDALPLPKSRSVGSLTTYSESVRSSYLRGPNTRDSSAPANVAPSELSTGDGGTFSLGAVAEKPKKKDRSFFSTHSSKPIMRPSFEAEAKKLAQIPDEEEDGGIESALAKLEGTYEKKSFKLSMEPTNAPLPKAARISVALGESGTGEEEKKEHRHLHIGDGEDAVMEHEHEHEYEHKRPTNADDTSIQGDVSTLQVPRTRPHTGARSSLSDKSGGSYSSVPLLERGLTDDGRSKAAISEWRGRSVLYGPDDPSPIPTPRRSREFGSQHPSYEFVQKTRSMERMDSGDVVPPSQHQSFLDDDSVDGSDLSSEMSAEVLVDDDYREDEYKQEETAFPTTMSRSASVKKLPAHSLGESREPPDSRSPPSPPMTLSQALQMSPETAKIPELHEHQIWSSQKPLPPTPDTTPTAAQHPQGADDSSANGESAQRQTQKGNQDLNERFSVHLPFILAFESEILAQQFTLIEKDALNEIDWKELIDMGWKNAANDSRSWVEFLRNTDAHGVEVVIARFNIMVKWVCSEIVLTKDLEERARCMIKFIHIAAHCRSYRNFATMSQIAIALTGQEVARLSKTWAMVPRRDLETLQELESLVSPMRNFYNLRAEMEGGSDSGCIPFVGIYTHDLLFNAQRPSEIASSPTTAPLVNFERCRYAATIVKTLLRLLEASTLYQFQPVEGITERCLWMSALSDDDIRKHSESME